VAITIVATAGSATANSFCTEAEAITYVATRLNASAWTTASGSTCTEDEKKALCEATREISALFFLGTRATDTQALAWPRLYAPEPDNPNSDYYEDTEIPQRVKDAAAELAFQFLKAGTTDIAALDANLGVVENTIDVLTKRYQPYQRPTGLARFPSVMRFLAPLLATTAGVTRLVRG